MKVLILTPEKIIYKCETIRSIRLLSTGKDCSFQLLDHHTSMITLLKERNIQLDQDKSKLIYSIKYGILKVKNSIVKILVY